MVVVPLEQFLLKKLLKNLIRQRNMPPPEDHVTSDREFTTVKNVTLIHNIALNNIIMILIVF